MVKQAMTSAGKDIQSTVITDGTTGAEVDPATHALKVIEQGTPTVRAQGYDAAAATWRNLAVDATGKMRVA